MIKLLTRHPTSLGNKLLRCVNYRFSYHGSSPHQYLQKLISGRYLGEILRLVICELIDEGVLFLGQNTYKLEKPYCFDTAFLSLMERYLFLILRFNSHFNPLLLLVATRRTNSL